MAGGSRSFLKYTGALAGNLSRANTGLQQVLGVDQGDPTIYGFTTAQRATLQSAQQIVGALLTLRVTQAPSSSSSLAPLVGSSSSSSASLISGSSASGS